MADPRSDRVRVVLIAGASLAWLLTVVCVLGLAFTADPSARLGFVILGVPFLAVALACTYGARSSGPTGAGEIARAAHGQLTAPGPSAVHLGALPGDTSALLERMRADYTALDASVSPADRNTEAWKTMTQIVDDIVPTTVTTYRRVAGLADADTEFVKAVRLLSSTFAERRSELDAGLLDGLHAETRYIQDRFTPSELTVDDRPPSTPSA